MQSPAAQAPAPEAHQSVAQQQAVADQALAHQASPTSSSTPSTSPVVQTAPTPADNNTPPAQPQPPAVQPAGLHPVTHPPLASTSSDAGLQQGANQGGGDLRDHTSKESAVTDATSDDAPPVDHSVAVPLPPATSAVPAPQGALNVHPTEIVNQIAQQVDLYRLPGGRGVRIQLHPEDLGGVQVTLRYAAGGSLELHINVEHGATGALVQASIGQLRDALATHGFQPDRLVMSVSAPSPSSQMDFSSSGNGGSYRSDSGLTAFMQGGQSGQQRDSDEDAPRRIGWTSDANSGPNGDAPAITTDATTSRIDYRV
jgi:flagellar hook-length control protein FliK